MRENGWLIELGSAPPRWWEGRGSDQFTWDASRAIRFARREDAERAIGWLVGGVREGCKATEHIWAERRVVRNGVSPMTPKVKWAGIQVATQQHLDELDAEIARMEAEQSVSPIPLNAEHEQAAKEWAADARLWTTQETVEFNLRIFARKIIALVLAAPSTPDGAPRPVGWQPIATAPERRKVLVTWVNALGKRRTAMASYWPEGTLDMADDVPDYQQDNDGHNLDAGWWEESEGNDDAMFRLVEKMTHWMPLPTPPADPIPEPRRSPSHEISQETD